MGVAGLITVLVIGMLLFVREEFNPDWLGYRLLYEGAGSWLADQNRDPLFLGLTLILAGVLGPDNYDSFRYLIGFYFAGFTFLLCIGRFLHLNEKGSSALRLTLGLLPFAAIRFTIQIREGIALTLVIVGMACLQGVTRRHETPIKRRPNVSRYFRASCLFVVACGIHSGVALLVVALLLSPVLGTGDSRRPIDKNRLRLMSSVATVSASLGALALSTAGSDLIGQLYGWAAETDLTTSFGKYVYWATYGYALWLVTRDLRRALFSSNESRELTGFLSVIGFVFLPAIYLAALVFLSMGTPAILISTAGRLMNMIVSLLILYMTWRGKTSLQVKLVALFVLIDQGRVVYEAVLTTYAGVFN